MTASHPHFFPFNPQDFACDGKVEAMSTIAVGAYILLLCKAWYENPPGTLPDDDAMLARWSRVNADTWIQIRSEVVAAFRFANGRWVQKRMVDEFRKAKRLIKARSDGGKSTAAKRWGSGSSAIGGQPQAEQSRAEQNRSDESAFAAGSSPSHSALPALPTTGREALTKIGVGEPALEILSPIVSSSEVLSVLQTVRQGRRNYVGVVVSELCKLKGVSLPKKSPQRVGSLTNGVLAKVGDPKAVALAQDRMRRGRGTA